MVARDPRRDGGRCVTRRDALFALGHAGALALLAGCRPGSGGASGAGDAVLYSSIDDHALRAAVPLLERATGGRVRTAGDTEATKTTGLVTRLLAEAASPRADAWWSSEPFGTVRLARAGVLAPLPEGTVPAGWPTWLVGAERRWVGHALRARVLAWHTERVPAPPARLTDLTDPAFRGRVGIARPQFGTTRGHMGHLAARWGLGPFEAWLAAMRDNALRLYDGNATVVRKIAEGEIDLGLTDTDDAAVAAARGWPVASTAEMGDGSLLVPCTIGVVAGRPEPGLGRALAQALLSPAVERLLAADELAHRPVHPELAGLASAGGWSMPSEPPDLDAAEAALDEALAACDRTLG